LPKGDESERAEPGPRLEAVGGDVVMGQAVTHQMEEGPRYERAKPRLEKDARGCAARNMERDDHAGDFYRIGDLGVSRADFSTSL
jgi:hypothetical protein